MRGPLQQLQARLGEDPGTASCELPQAAVLVALDLRGADSEVILTRRADHMRLHAGEVAFPGGKCDSSDKDHWATALREAEEEIALIPAQVSRLGTMAPVVTRTGIEVTPCVGHLRGDFALRPNREEIDSIFTVPLEFLSQRTELHFDTYDYGGRERQVPRYEWQEYSIWGVTAAILVKLVNLACDAGLEMEDYWKGSAES